MMYHLWRGLEVGWAASDIVSYPALASFRIWVTPNCRPASTRAKKTAASTTMIATITEVIQVSLRVVQVILRVSARTSLANCARLVFFFGWLCATAAGEAIAAAALAARLLIACGVEPGFLAMAAFFKLVF